MDKVKSDILFFNPEQCTGCRACEMVCSLYKTGDECSPGASCIKVATHPYLYSSVILVSSDCSCRTGEECCVEICNRDALCFLNRLEAPAMLNNVKWLPSPIV